MSVTFDKISIWKRFINFLKSMMSFQNYWAHLIFCATIWLTYTGHLDLDVTKFITLISAILLLNFERKYFLWKDKQLETKNGKKFEKQNDENNIENLEV